MDWLTPRTKAYSLVGSKYIGDGNVTLVGVSPLSDTWISSGLTTARAKSWTNCVVGVPNSVVRISTVRFSLVSFVAKNKSTEV